jgi:hypothetical protein
MSHPDPTQTYEDCTLCDERGMIADPVIKGASSSCDCGKYNRLMKEKFKDVSIEELMAYGRMRVEEKKLQVNCECEPNESDDDSDKEARDMSNNYPPNMDTSLIS